MTRAIADHATDMIGLARPLTSEPRLCEDLVSGCALGARPNLVSEDMQVAASIIQIPIIARGEAIPDLSNAEIASEWENLIRESRRRPAQAQRDTTQGAYKSQL
jgi:hypothetical protein